MQNILNEEWYKYSMLEIYSLEWNFGSNFAESSNERPRLDFWWKIPKFLSTSGVIILF